MKRKEFHEQLQATLDKYNKNDIITLMGDLNAKVGTMQNKDMEEMENVFVNLV